MSTHEEQFLKSLRTTFKVEAGEHLETIAASLLALEKSNSDGEKQQLIETVFRAAHSLKGAARAVNYTAVESICQTLEDVFAAWKRGETKPNTQALDVVHQALDAVSRILSDADKSGSVPSSHVQALRRLSSSELPAFPVEQVSRAEKEETMPAVLTPAVDKIPVIETVRVDVAKLDARLLGAEEMLAAKLVTRQRASDLHDLTARLEEWKEEWAKIQPETRALRQTLERSERSAVTVSQPTLKRLIEFFDWNHDYLRSLENKVTMLSRAVAQDNLLVGKLVDDLLDDSKRFLMLPMSTLGGFFKKLVRDLCRDRDKQADLVIIGEEVEIDKRILEEMKDPLIHLIRNCVDHGLEQPDSRVEQGKPPRATITLTVSPLNGDKVELVVNDDGAGIDLEMVKECAVKHGLINAQGVNRLSESEALALIFRADISTTAIITRLSGRGLGLAIVREQTERLGGNVSVESVRNVGTTIRITLPVALRTFRGVLFQAAHQYFIVPTAQVERVTRFMPEDVQTVGGRETLAINGRAVALTSLADVLELQSASNGEGSGTMSAVILGAGDEQVAFAVDAVLDEQEVLVKRLSKPLERVRNIAGATVLGSGEVAPILNVSDLLKSAKKSTGSPVRKDAHQKPAKAKSILVVEDSITSRMLLKGVLESAGYIVKTAVDGADAFTTLRTQSFDLVVSDIEMPRMNGFELTARIRADKKLMELPVVLVTALETREDHERGIDVGANAYLIKSSFDQSNLLEIIRQLV